ncbi:MAG: acetoacetate--CoA ligase [Gammaproteobacteria bacterium]|nr:acetoacetate--CoA ligase [Gammaproteobacteria bacterium]MBU2677932.1 acetoacetate--CoA ligase [Gammaproteobacteria bacterium]NNC57017.1 acetoacetate--CoA ligase [Woeseiaceae bacterium]NNL51665.1 acetoacetate--CoA ligase [Woeseiaceae bacterium]
MSTVASNPIIWSPGADRVQASAMYRFMREAGFDDFDSLYEWSVTDAPAFWEAVCEFCAIHFDKAADQILRRPDTIMDAGWFDGSQLNYAANLLRNGGDGAAIIFVGENGARRELSHDDLRAAVAAIAAGLKAVGIGKGDRVAGFLPNCPEAVIAMLATASLGAIWSSCSPDFGVNGVVDRFGQIRPRVLFAPNGYYYNGKTCDTRPVVDSVVEKIPEIEHVVVLPFVNDLPVTLSTSRAVTWSDFSVEGSPLDFTPVDFDHPLYIMFSSGTTGVPKCIVHGHGGSLLQHMKEHVLHTDIGARDRLFYFTTCGWMMWNWLVSGLATGATLVLFDGSPFYKDGRILWQMAEKERVTVFGTSAKYISALEKAGVRPGDEFDLPELRALLSTGSPLAPESFDYVYDAIGADLQLASISGGTDIVSCFALGNPVLPVRRGELQCRGLGMAVQIFNEEGRAVVGEHGELVCTQPFPSAPVGFWDDADGSRYRAAYFERFPGVWAHGDFAELTEHGGIIIHGRSDAVLNPGGVRIGTAEIYRQVEKLDEIVESIAIGQHWGDDVRVVLFVIVRDGIVLDESLKVRIKSVIRENTTPRHVPAKIVAVPEIPRTKSGKIVELAVRSVVHGEAVKNTDALANPDALAYFADVPELSED